MCRPLYEKKYLSDQVKQEMDINILYLSGTKYQHKSGSKLPEVIVRCLAAPNHWLKWRKLIIKGVPWHSPWINFIKNTHLQKMFSSYTFKFAFTSPGDQQHPSSTQTGTGLGPLMIFLSNSGYEIRKMKRRRLLLAAEKCTNMTSIYLPSIRVTHTRI